MEGNNVIKRITESNQIEIKNTSLNICQGMQESEIEDYFNKETYESEIKNKYGIKLDCSEFRSNEKWTVRMKKTFNAQGQLWNEKIENDIKILIANIINEKFEEKMLIEQKSSALRALIEKVEDGIKNKE